MIPHVVVCVCLCVLFFYGWSMRCSLSFVGFRIVDSYVSLLMCSCFSLFCSCVVHGCVHGFLVSVCFHGSHCCFLFCPFLSAFMCFMAFRCFFSMFCYMVLIMVFHMFCMVRHISIGFHDFHGVNGCS